MLGERVENGVHLLDALLGLFDLALDDHQRSGDLVEHVGTAGIELVLAALELFKARLFFFDFLLLLLEAFELGADLLNLVAQLSRGVVFEVKIGIWRFAVVFGGHDNASCYTFITRGGNCQSKSVLANVSTRA